MRMVARLLFALLCVNAGSAPDTLVVCPPPSPRPWIAGSRSVSPKDTASGSIPIRLRRRRSARASVTQLASAACSLCCWRATRSLRAERGEPPAPPSVPTHQAIAKVNVRWGSEPEIATDNWYADLDDDQLPDVAIGRLTARSVEDLAAMVEKTLAYERIPRPGNWQRRVSIVAGAGGFGPVLDTVLELATKKFLTEGIPPEYTTSLTYGSWRSPYCPDPRMLNATTLARLNEGSLLWVYLGHGRPTRLEPMRLSGYIHHVLDTDDVVRLQRTGGPPIAVFLSVL